jgi:ubiquinone/menaquinone biosynthesis C-methylase UbiE
MVQMSSSEVNKLMTDMYNAFCRLPLEAGEFFYEKISEKMKGLNNTSLYCFDNFKAQWQKAVATGVDVSQASILEIGAGLPLGTGILWNFVGARKYTSIDKFMNLNLNELWLQRFQSFIDLNLHNPSGFRIDSIIRKQGDSFSANRDRLDFVKAPFEDTPLEDKSFDYVYSVAVLEHVDDVGRMLAKMHRVMADGAVGFHVIDLREHHTNLRQVPDKNTSTEFLKYSRAEWEELYPPGSPFYVNRLRASDFVDLFEKTGFEIVDLEVSVKMELDEGVYRRIHPEFHNYTVEDLSTLGIMVVSRKKAPGWTWSLPSA